MTSKLLPFTGADLATGEEVCLNAVSELIETHLREGIDETTSTYYETKQLTRTKQKKNNSDCPETFGNRQVEIISGLMSTLAAFCRQGELVL